MVGNKYLECGQLIPVETGFMGSALVQKIRPSRAWQWTELAEVWKFRDLLWTLALRDLKLRYRQTALGVLWVVFQPVAGAGVLSLVFGWVAGLSRREGYFTYSMAGLLVWNAFQSTLLKASMSLVGNAALVSKVYFPRVLLPLSTVLSTMVDFLIGALVLVLVCLASSQGGWSGFVFVPFWILMSQLLAVGLGLLAAASMARFRDIQHVLPMMLPFLMYATPVAYSMDRVPERFVGYFKLNPISWIIEGGRSALIGVGMVPFSWVLYVLIVSIGVLFAGYMVFRRMERGVADIL